jgi:hypothetical protein
MRVRCTAWSGGVFVVALALVVALAGCGSRARSAPSGLTVAPEKGHTRTLSLSPPSPKRRAEGPCQRARVAVGKDPRVIEITAWCRSTAASPHVGFTLSRYVPGSTTVIPNLGRVKRVVATESGVGASPARCVPVQGGVFCGAAAHGRIVINVVLEVPPGTRCQQLVSVMVSFDATCRDKPCVGALTTYSLYSRRPTGC